MDAGVLAFSFVLALGTALLFGIVPALRGSRVGLRGILTAGGRTGSGGRGRNRLRSALVVIEVALGVVLLASAGLLARSFYELSEVRPGYDVSRIVTMQFALSDVRYRDLARCEKFFETLVTDLERTPGVESAGTTNFLPLQKQKQSAGIWLDSQPVHSTGDKDRFGQPRRIAGLLPGHGCSTPSGRYFKWTDRPDSAKVFDRQRCVCAGVLPARRCAGQAYHHGPRQIDLDWRRLPASWAGSGNPIWRWSRAARCLPPIRKRRFLRVRW